MEITYILFTAFTKCTHRWMKWLSTLARTVTCYIFSITVSKQGVAHLTLNFWFWQSSSKKHPLCLSALSMEHPPVIKETVLEMGRLKVTENTMEPGITKNTGNTVQFHILEWDVVNYGPLANYVFISAHSNPPDICCLSFYVLIGLNDCE